jgi:GAF domain-containing protein
VFKKIMKAPVPTNEAQRLEALKSYQILDTEAEQIYDGITALAAHVCNAPVAMVSLVDESRQWFKAKVGVSQQQTPRDVAFCAHTILKDEPLFVSDALTDSRFADSALVTGEPGIRFYAGYPLVSPEGFALGALCVIDREPRKLSAKQQEAMQILARQVMALLEMRRISARLAEALANVKSLESLLPICAWCHRIRDDKGRWSTVEVYLKARTDTDFTHGICPECRTKHFPPKPQTP